MQAISIDSKNIFHRRNIQYGYMETVDAVSGEVIAVQKDYNESFILGKMDELIQVEIDGKTILMQKGMSLTSGYVPRNSKFSRPLADLIVQDIIEGTGITKACKKYDITYPTLMRWAEQYPEFGKELEKAKKYRADATHDEIVDFAKDLTTKQLNKTQVEAIGRAADLLKWSAEKSDPTRFGNKAEKNVNTAVQIIIQTGIDRTNPETVTAEVIHEG
jgi:transposase-like protein